MTEGRDLSDGHDYGEAERAYLQERMALLGRVGPVIVVLLFVFVLLSDRAGAVARGATWAGALGGVLLLTSAMGVITHARRLSYRALQALDTAAALSTCALISLHSWVVVENPEFRLAALAGLVAALCTRATAVPSAAAHTAAIGASGAALVAAPALLPFLRPDAPPEAWTHAGLFFGWSVVAVFVSTFISKVVHGLQRRVARLGRYRLEAKIGSGGMGEVYLAHHAMLRRPAAVKLLRPELAGGRALDRFEREVQATARLSHPNTVQIFDYGRTPDGIFFYAMEYLDGVDLGALLQHDGPMHPGRLIAVLRQVLGSLDEAHEAGLVHRDVKAANVLVCERGGSPDVVKVLDFGLVLDRDPGASSPDAAENVVGTPAYLSPEGWARPDEVDRRSDLYAVGVLGWTLLAGRPPFVAPNLVVLCRMHTYQEAPRLNAQPGVRVSHALESALMRCLNKAPADRPESAAELAAALARCPEAGTWSEDDARAWWAARRGDLRPETAPLDSRSVIETARFDALSDDGWEDRATSDPPRAGARGRAGP